MGFPFFCDPDLYNKDIILNRTVNFDVFIRCNMHIVFQSNAVAICVKTRFNGKKRTRKQTAVVMSLIVISIRSDTVTVMTNIVPGTMHDTGF